MAVRITTIALYLVLMNLVGCAPKDPTVREPDVAVARIEARGGDKAILGQGRGFFVSADGWMVTALHVVEGAQDITVRRAEKPPLFAELVQSDKDADLAILRVHATDLPFLHLDSDEIEPGVHVRLLAGTGVEHGVFDHWEDFGNAIHVTVPLLPIDAGSPLLADDGRVIAIARGPAKDAPGQSLATPAFRVLKMMPALQN